MSSVHDLFALLPDELLELAFNGTDTRGVAFFDPTQRVFLALVCRRWMSIIASPSPRWVRGHLNREAMILGRHGSAAHERRMVRAFLQGRMLTASGLVLFLRAAEFGSRWSLTPIWPAGRAIPCPSRVVSSRRNRHRCREYRTRLLVRSVLGTGRPVLRLGRACSIVSFLVDGTVDAYYGETKRKSRAPVTSWTRPPNHYGRFGPMARCDYTQALVSLGHIDEAVRMLKNSYGPAWDVLRCVAAFASRGVDDPTDCMRLISISCNGWFESLPPRHRDVPALVWTECARTGMAHTLYLLHDFIGKHRYSHILSSWLDYTLQVEWTRHAVEGLDPLGVLGAHGARISDAKEMLKLALRGERYEVADALLSMLAQNGIGQLKALDFIKRLIVERPGVASWASRLGYTPSREDVCSMLRTDPTDAVRALAASWPAVLPSSACCVRAAIAACLFAGKNDRASHIVHALSSLSVPSCARGIWDMVLAMSACRCLCNYHRDATGRLASHRAVSRAAVLAHVDRMTDPQSNPDTYVIWRAWCDPSGPLDAAEGDSART